jgi:tetratricopeptide (TPR) repeat protein
MQTDNPLQRAIAAARSGHELTARDLFLDIVKADPQNELAWLWLTGLLDDLEDCIYACEKVLEINPENAHARRYRDQLLERREKEVGEVEAQARAQKQAALEAVRSATGPARLDAVRRLTLQRDAGPEAWRLLAESTPDLTEQVHALERVVDLAPDDPQAKVELDRLKRLQGNPLELAMHYEDEGKLDQAIAMYTLAMQNPSLRPQWNRLYWKIASLENQEQERIAHISPVVSTLRLTFTPALLYLVLMLIQIGINPIAYPDPILWFGFPSTVLGGFLIALASARAYETLWGMISKNTGLGATPPARSLLSASGWLLVLFPYIFLFVEAFLQLANF